MAMFERGQKVKVRIDGKLVETTVGRVLIGDLLPANIPFETVNKVMTKKTLAQLIDYTYRHAGTKKTVIFLVGLKDLA